MPDKKLVRVDDQIWLDNIQRWLKETTEEFDTWDWDGKVLSIIVGGDIKEKYDKATLLKLFKLDGERRYLYNRIAGYIDVHNIAELIVDAMEEREDVKVSLTFENAERVWLGVCDVLAETIQSAVAVNIESGNLDIDE